MLILTLRTDNPEAEIGLYHDTTQLAYETWHAHRQLAETMHNKISTILESQSKTLHDIEGIACYSGPGSFTGLRIGLTVANTLAYALQTNIVSDTGDGWQNRAVKRLMSGKTEKVAVPFYGAEANITKPKASA